MGVDCKISLPEKIRYIDVIDVMNASLGCKKEKEQFRDSNGWFVKFEENSIKVVDFSIHSLLNFEWDNLNLIRTQGFVSYHMEWGASSKGRLGRGMMPKSTAFWIAMGHRLVDFFGGEVDYNDCDVVDVNYKKPIVYKYMPDNGKAWQDVKQRIYDIEPLTIDEIKSYEDVSGYGLGPDLLFAENI